MTDLSEHTRETIERHARVISDNSPLTERRVRSLLYYERTRLNYEEIGEIIGISKGAVNDHVRAAKEKWLQSEFVSLAGGQFVPFVDSINKRSFRGATRLENPQRSPVDFSQEIWDFETVPLPVGQMLWEDVRPGQDSGGRFVYYEVEAASEDAHPHWLKAERWTPSDDGTIEISGDLSRYDWKVELIEEGLQSRDYSCLTECVALCKLAHVVMGGEQDRQNMTSPKEVYDGDWSDTTIKALVDYGYLEDWVAVDLFTDQWDETRQRELRQLLGMEY